jgi:hypothetical protein
MLVPQSRFWEGTMKTSPPHFPAGHSGRRIAGCVARGVGASLSKRSAAQRRNDDGKARSGSKEFTFWWGEGYLPTAYFNVSIEPNADGLDLIPLIEEGRKTTTIAPNGLRQPQLILTLRNNNGFDVPFFANHILVSI